MDGENKDRKTKDKKHNNNTQNLSLCQIGYKKPLQPFYARIFFCDREQYGHDIYIITVMSAMYMCILILFYTHVL